MQYNAEISPLSPNPDVIVSLKGYRIKVVLMLSQM